MPKLRAPQAELNLREQISRRELRLMTVVEVGELLGISKYECVMRWLRENNVPSYRVNGRRKYAEVDVARVLYLAREV